MKHTLFMNLQLPVITNKSSKYVVLCSVYWYKCSCSKSSSQWEKVTVSYCFHETFVFMFQGLPDDIESNTFTKTCSMWSGLRVIPDDNHILEYYQSKEEFNIWLQYSQQMSLATGGLCSTCRHSYWENWLLRNHQLNDYKMPFQTRLTSRRTPIRRFSRSTSKQSKTQRNWRRSWSQWREKLWILLLVWFRIGYKRSVIKSGPTILK